MESPTTMQARIPDPATSKRLLANLRKTQLEMAGFNQELAAINEMLAKYNRQQWANRQSPRDSTTMHI